MAFRRKVHREKTTRKRAYSNSGEDEKVEMYVYSCMKYEISSGTGSFFSVCEGEDN